MKKLLLLRGAVGSGKSSLVTKLGLDDYTISNDRIRVMLGSRELTPSGFRLPHSVNKQTYDIAHSLLEERMKRGEFTVVDAVNSDYNSCKYYMDLANKYRYEIAYYQMETSLKECLKINKSRDYFKQVAKGKVVELYKKIDKSNLPIRRIYDINKYIDEVKVFNLDSYKKVIIIGSLNGKFKNFEKILGDIDSEIKYIVLGNYFKSISLCGDGSSYWLDRLAELSNYANIELLEGSRDSLLDNKLHNRLLDSYLFSLNNRMYFCCSGGLPYLPDRLGLISSYQLINGACDNPSGLWELNKDKNKGFIQFSSGNKSICNSNSYSLNGLDRVVIRNTNK